MRQKSLFAKVFAGILAATTVLSACTGGTSSSSSATESGSSAAPSSSQAESSEAESKEESASAAGVSKDGLPIVTEKITLNAMVNKDINTPDWETHPAVLELEKRTNIDVNWESVPNNGWEEKRNLRFASNDLPDFILRAKLSAQLEMKYAAADQLVALDTLMDYAPNLSKLMEENPVVEKNIKMPDGHIYSLPQLNRTEGNLVQHYWINKTWIDKLGLSMPETIDDFYNVLVAFRDQDPNGNGQKDEIGYAGTAKDNPSSIFYTFLGSWGYGKHGGINHDTNAFSFLDIGDDDVVRLIATEDKFKNMVEYFNKLWSENLIDKESFSQDRDQIVAKITADQVGFSSDGNNSQWMGPNRVNFVQPPALKGPDGENYWTNRVGFVQTTGTAAITTANKYPEATMRFLDYFYSHDGTVLARLGIEGTSYYVDENGKYQLFDEIKNDPTGLTLDQALGKYALYMGGNLCQYITDDVDQSAAQLPETKEAVEVVRPSMIDPNDIPRFTFTEEETVKLSSIATDIVAYCEENVTKFITGERSLSEWDAYVSELSKMDVDGYIKIYQDAYDRWKA